MKRSMILAAIAGLSLADVLSTNAGLAKGAVEANPVMATAQAVLGDWWPLARLGAMLPLCAGLYRIRWAWPSALIAGYYAALVVSNVVIIG